ncbi:hypothetical protein [Pedobacter alpinus]|uniref:Rad50/SbcC-type AAA domain-containing protein n=1 Tax=Pedobacter alpinus TaxID=1590643 RepID=A0ABW5TMR7_9SPHI
MASTTTTKKEIVDFLWEWAETQEDWGKLLISRIVSTENELTTAERQSVFDYFLEPLKKSKTLPILTITKPKYTPTSKQIELAKLCDITGVNRLAKNQSIHFGKNLTVVFGENGTGKTGYGRVLKSLGFSYDKINKIISNIYATTQPKTATIEFKANGVDKVFNWDGTNTLTGLSVPLAGHLNLNKKKRTVSGKKQTLKFPGTVLDFQNYLLTLRNNKQERDLFNMNSGL